MQPRSRGSSSSSAGCSTRDAPSRRTSATIPESARPRRRRATRCTRPPAASTRRRRSSSGRRRGRSCADCRPTSAARSSTTSPASTVRPPRSGPAPRERLIVGVFTIAALGIGTPATAVAQAAAPPAAQDSQQESPDVSRAIELENAGKFRDAIPLYRQAMRTNPTPIVVLGLERSYAELGMTDSLLAPLDSLLTRFPKEPLYHVVHLRSFQILRRYDAMRAAFERWVHDDPRNASPYGTYARMLIEIGQPATADSIIERGRIALGTARDL